MREKADRYAKRLRIGWSFLELHNQYLPRIVIDANSDTNSDTNAYTYTNANTTADVFDWKLFGFYSTGV